MKKKYLKKDNFALGTEIEDYVFAVTETEAARIEKPLERKRLNIFLWLTIVVLLLLGTRIFFLAVIRGAYYQNVAQGNKIRSIVIKAPRGKIYDRSGTALVSNIPSLDLVVIPADLPKDSEKKAGLVRSLAVILELNEEELLKKITEASSNSFNPILVKESISQDEALIFTERGSEFPGAFIEKTAVREYADSIIFSHLLGYQGKIEKKELVDYPEYSFTDYIGKQGLEKSYEESLRGINGAFQVEVDSQGAIKKERGVINPQPGKDLILSIDAGLQKKVFDSLTAVLEQTETKTAAAVAINPRNGEVLALVSLPAFDNNLFSQKLSRSQYAALINDPNKPLFNRALSGEYPPGSTLKPLVVVAGLSEGVIDENTTVNCSGEISVGSYRFRDWKTHGVTNLKKALAESCDVFFYSVGGGYGQISGLGMSRMKKYEDAFGLGRITGIDIPGEANGLIPDENWKWEKIGEKWFIGNSYHAAIGQGYITTTPLQLANYIAAIANGGMLYQPKIVSRIGASGDLATPLAPKIIKEQLASAEVIRAVKLGMRETILSGTAQSLADLPVAVAGKTGTAQFGSENKTHAWFVSFAPFENPEIALAILVEGGGEGHSSAVPATKEIYQWYFGDR